MKGIAGKQTRGVCSGSVLNVVDNTGAKTIEIITVPGYHGTSTKVPSAAWATSSSPPSRRGPRR